MINKNNPEYLLSPHAAMAVGYPDPPESIEDFAQLTAEQLRVEFMRLSPTYALGASLSKEKSKAKRIGKISAHYEENVATTANRGLVKNANQLTKGEIEKICIQFDAVISAHSTYGDIYRPYADWYLSIGFKIFDNFLNRQRVELLGKINSQMHRQTSNESFMKRFNRLIDRANNDPEFSETLVISIPLNLTKKLVYEQLKKMLEWEYIFSYEKDMSYRRKKPLASKRERLSPLQMKLRLLMYKALHPDETLWELGLRANVSPTYTKKLSNPKLAKDIRNTTRIHLAALTNRALRSAQYIAEHAAHDVFPSTEKIITPRYDWAEVKNRLLTSYPTLCQSVK
jgi:hypothetical protein